MPRDNKKSRMKFLPPKIQLDIKSAATGSYPTNSRLSIDGRTGNYNVSYDDTKTINFGEAGLFDEFAKDIIYYLRAGDLISTDGTYDYFLPSIIDKDYVGTPESVAMGHTIRPAMTYLDILPEDAYDEPGNALLYPDSSTFSFVANPIGSNLFRVLTSDLITPFAVSLYVETDLTTHSEVPIALLSSNASGTARLWDITLQGHGGDPVVRTVRFTVHGRVAGFPPTSSTIQVFATGAYGSKFWIHANYNGSKTRRGLSIYITDENGNTFRPSQGYGGTSGILFDRLAASAPRINLGRTEGAATNAVQRIEQFVYFKRQLSINEFAELAQQGSKSYRRFYSVPAKHLPTGIIYGTNLPGSSPFIDLNDKEQSSTYFIGPGKTTKGVGDANPMVHFTPGQEGGPFRDNDQYAVDGKSQQSEFYSTGTPVEVAGEGFDGPLWSKDKIEIDITPSQTTAHFSLVETWPLDDAFVGHSTPMVYYNFEEKKWNGIGNEYWYNYNRPQDGQHNHCLGFAGGLVNIPYGAAPANEALGLYYLFELIKSSGDMTNAYGFPYDARYHANPGNTFKLSNVIDKPFLVEKIDISLECDFGMDPNIQNGTRPDLSTYNLTASFVPASINNIFVAVQRKNAKINVVSSEYLGETGFVTQSILPITRQVDQNSGMQTINTIRDVITFAKITGYCSNIRTEYDRSAFGMSGKLDNVANIKTLLSGTVNIETGVPMTNSLSALNWTRRRLRFSLPAMAQNKNSLGSGAMSETRNTTIGTPDDEWPWGLRKVFNNGGNNNLGVEYPTGRNINSFLGYIKNRGDILIFPTVYSEPPFTMPQVEGNLSKVVPYILQPSDELILGWQMPTPTCFEEWENYTTGAGQGSPGDPGTGLLSQVRFFNAPAKIVLYGSYISDGKPKNDSLNQLLSSDSVHEVIGED